MTDVVIRAENLSKLYRIGELQRRTTLRESIVAAVRGALRPSTRRPTETVWALKDVSFEIGRGEVVGIIGRNGAGKSTLLKILARITEPTSGRAEVRGRVGSLLEVGTGFHSELTGRENIFLSGAILGMRRTEIVRRFDEIVAFAEVERFIDTPVKHYSTGMYLRLAFAVAAHLEPEILLVDEVLAVGDAAFQKKCLGKMGDVSRQGRTVLFVSHNLTAVTRICSRALMLGEGRLAADGPSPSVAHAYLGSGLGTSSRREWLDAGRAPGNEVVRLRAVRVLDQEGKLVEAADIREPVGIQMEYDVLMGGSILVPNLHVFNAEGLYLFVSADHEPEWRGRPRKAGHYRSTAWIPGNFLSEGGLVVGAAVSTLNPLRIHFYERDVVAFEVVDTMDGDSTRGEYAGHVPGVIRPSLRWTTSYAAFPPGDEETTA
jgi:lipopolysaccharide transport system ATP-binding protein